MNVEIFSIDFKVYNPDFEQKARSLLNKLKNCFGALMNLITFLRRLRLVEKRATELAWPIMKSLE